MSDAAILLSAAAIIVLPGLVLRAALGPVRTLHWSAAPALSVVAAGLLPTLYAPVGISWTPATALLGLLALGLLLHVVLLMVDGRRLRGQDVPAVSVLVPVLGIVSAAIVHALAALSVMGDVGRINNSYDAFFHTAAIAFMRSTGDASMLSGTAPMYSGVPHYYPTPFDALAALLPGDPIAAANALSIMIVPVGALSAIGLVETVVPERTRGACRALVVLAASMTVLAQRSPDAMALALGLWPNLLGTVLLAAVLGSTVRAVRGWTGASRRERSRDALELGLVALGAGLAHPSVVFAVVVLLLCTAAALVLLPADGTPPGRAARVGGAGVLALGGLLFVLVNMRLRHMDMTPAPPGGAVRFGLDVLADRPRLGVLPWEPWVAAPVLLTALVGVLIGWRRGDRVVAAAGVAAPAVLALVVLGATDVPVLRDLTNVWYGAPERVIPTAAPALAVLCAAALEAVLHRAAHGPARKLVLAATVLAVLAGSGTSALPSRTPAMADLFTSPDHDRYLAYVTPEEQRFITRAAHELPEDAVVLGDPLDGTSAFWTAGGTRVVYPSLVVPGTLDTRRVGLYGDQMYEDPAVCASMRRLGVTHLYRDTSAASGALIAAHREEQPWMGLHRIPVRGLQPVEQEGPYALYALDLPC